jgi:hypothetical protein
VLGVHERFICEVDTAVAERLVGVDGGVVSGVGVEVDVVIDWVVAFTIDEYEERLPAASTALTLYLYVVLADRFVSEYEAVEGVAI